MQALSPRSRIWIYQANEPFNEQVTSEIRQHVDRFAQQWVSHNKALRAAGDVLHDRFLVLAVDESQAGASGCSIDSSVAFVKNVGVHYQRDLFDRMRFSYEDTTGEVQTVDKDTFAERYAAGIINDDTIVFDTLVDTLDTFQNSFRKPLKDSWHHRFV